MNPKICNMQRGDKVLIETLFAYKVGTIKTVMLDPSAPNLPVWTQYLVEYRSYFGHLRQIWLRGGHIKGWMAYSP